MERTDYTGDIVLSVPSEDKYIRLLDLVVFHVAKEMDFAEEAAQQLNLAVIEAATNAMRHGNCGDPGKAIQIRFCIAEDKLTVCIKDCGAGFDLEKIGDPLIPENVMKPCGRGVFLMKTLMDEVEYCMNGNSGTEVRLVKYKNPQE